MGGLGCYSLDGELLRDSGYGPILKALVKQEFVTMRVEKTDEDVITVITDWLEKQLRS